MPTEPIPEDLWFEPSVQLEGSGIVIRPALRLLTLATLEESISGMAADVAGRPRTSCVPFVIIQNWSALFPDLGPANYTLSESRFYFPLALEFDNRASFDITELQGVIILLISANGKRLELPISRLFADFILLTETLGMMLQAAGDNTFRVLSVPQEGSDVKVPQVADTGALMSQANFDRILKSPRAWRAKISANPRLYVDQANDSVTYEHYFIDPVDRRVSKTLVQEICLLCLTTENITREHCTPNWLMKKMQLQPIVASVLCETCNNEQGRKLESPIEQAFIAGSFLSDEKLTNMWALKTALTLAASQNIHVPRVLAEAVRAGDTSLGGAQVLALRDQGSSPKREFRFVVASLSDEDRENGRFALLFTFLDFSFLVLRWKHASPSLETLVRDITSTQYPEVSHLGVMHILLERLSGTRLVAKLPGETWL
ncbi:hypothetical protein H9638_07245 [Arthrobacter sp. Sa2BUA2]|uniref:Uncharacterized protein n=1 Tax=Arthrobacter pullicola TaxID=2762224 RepID=A0ABR8YHB3_9MICC|nr:hypothetical protein [Arthrobacter pullicola]MBD8043606.1 hypothetical protein [Arthrobacter pullicola]